VRVQTLLLGAAGLLPGPGKEGSPGNRTEVRQAEEPEGRGTPSRHTRAMSPEAWNLFKVRPNNAPSRRLVAMSYLLLR
jgi:hypothetical protein